jgi:hypothetical protein
MNKGTLVQIKNSEHYGLFIVMEQVPMKPCSPDKQFIRLYSLKHNRICFDMIRSLEVMNESR